MHDFSAQWDLIIATDASIVCQENEHLYSKNGAAASVATAAEVLRGNSSKIKEKPATVKRKSAMFTWWPVQAQQSPLVQQYFALVIFSSYCIVPQN